MSRVAVAGVVTAALSLALLPGAGAGATSDPCDEPLPYEPSQPVYDVVAEPKQYVELWDGTQIQADVYRPAAEGRFPVLVWFDVYYKDDPDAVVNSERDYFVSRGYGFVHASSPGSNTSGGTYDNAFGQQEQEAASAVVEWAGRQAWSDGRVGMNGLSYSAIIQYFVGARRPENLVTLYPAAAYSDLYREIVYIGGNLQAGYPVAWDVNNRTLAYLPPTNLGDQPATTLANYATSVGGWRPIATDMLLRPHDDDFYRLRSPAETNHQIEVPFAVDVGWHDDMLYGGPLNFETVGSAQKRMVIGPWGHSETHRRDGGRFERLRWYDHHLKGLPSGVDCDPPVRIFVQDGGRRDVGEWREEPAWPLERTTYETLHFGPSSTLVPDRPHESGSASYRYLPGRVDLWEGLSFTSAPLEHDLEWTGYAELVLHASIDVPDTHFTVQVDDVAPDGSRTRIQRGWLRAAAREIDESRSQPGRPFHRYTGDSPVPPGEPVEYRIAIWPTSTVFRAGHRIRVSINDAALGPSGTPFATPPYPGTNTLHWGGDTPSRLVLPVTPDNRDLSTS